MNNTNSEWREEDILRCWIKRKEKKDGESESTILRLPILSPGHSLQLHMGKKKKKDDEMNTVVDHNILVIT